MINSEIKNKIIKQFAKSEKDVGSIEVQIAMLTARIKNIAEHVKMFPKDKHSNLGLIKLVGKRRRFTKYLRKTDKASFDKIERKLESI